MYLKRGLSLYSNIDAISDQLSINEGTLAATTKTGLKYHPGSHIPKKDWRRLNSAEMRLLLTNRQNIDYRKTVCIGELPQNLKVSFQSLGLQECTQLEQVLPKLKEDEAAIKRINTELDEFLAQFSTTRNYKYHRLTRAMPNRETITAHYIGEEFIYIGLHIDQSRLFTPHTAHKSGNRISINLSKETRQLAFVNLTLIQVYNLVKHKVDPAVHKINPDTIATHFFAHYPDYPVVKIDIKPYQYYIAPTDNFLHDATTLGNADIDITIVYIGVFDHCALIN